MMADPQFLSGQLLLAMPGMEDPRFERAVIAMCSHDEGGALGVDLGRLVPRLGLHALMQQVEVDHGLAPDAPVLLGGPVEQQRGAILHSLDWGGEGTVQVADRFALTTTLDVLKALADGKGPARWVPALGYAGWGAGQLEEELAGNSWFVVPATDHLLYECAADARWSEAFASAGVDVRLLTADFGTA